MIALTPLWLSSSRGCCGGRLLRCRLVVTFGRPGFFVKGSGIRWRTVRKCPRRRPSSIATYVERAVFQFPPVRGRLRAEVQLSPVPEHPPLGQCFVRALPAKWRAVVAALARAIHGGYQGFTLPLRFNGRPYLRRVPSVGNTKWTTVIEDVWEHMAMKKREMKGHGEPIVPRA